MAPAKEELAWKNASSDLEFILRDVHDTDEDRGQVSPRFGSDVAEAVTTGNALCSPPTARRCAAIRSGRLVDFSDKSGLVRCPFLEDPDSHVLCAPVAAAGKSFAVAQVASQNRATTESLSTDA